MDEVGPVMISEEAIRTDARRFKIASVIAVIACTPFMITHTVIAIIFPTITDMSLELGGELSFLTKTLFNLSNKGVLAGLLIIDVVIFIAMYLLAKRYWIGLLFVPFFIYGVISSLLLMAMYMPMFNVITLIK